MTKLNPSPKKNWMPTSAVSKIVDEVDLSFRNNFINDAILFYSNTCNFDNYRVPTIMKKNKVGRPKKDPQKTQKESPSLNTNQVEQNLYNMKSNSIPNIKNNDALSMPENLNVASVELTNTSIKEDQDSGNKDDTFESGADDRFGNTK
jgi:hypothetical protein